MLFYDKNCIKNSIINYKKLCCILDLAFIKFYKYKKWRKMVALRALLWYNSNMKRISARAIIIEGDKIGLMYRRTTNHSFYCMPGGKQEVGEDLEETVVREIKEEFGIDIVVIKKVYEFISESAHQHFYLCKWVDGIFGTGEGEEFSLPAEKGYYEPRLVNVSHLNELHILPKELAKQLRKDYKKYGPSLGDTVKVLMDEKPASKPPKLKSKKRENA